MQALREYSKNQLSKNAVTFMVVDEGGLPLSSWDSRVQFDEIVNFPLSFAGPQITLPINPTDLIRQQLIRTEVTPSVMFSENKPQAIVQNWGAATPKWTLRGHTGYRVRAVEALHKGTSPTSHFSDEANYMDGYLTYVALYRFFEAYCKMNVLRLQDSPPRQSYQMVFINWSDKFQDWWFVEPTKMPDKIRTADKPLYYFYDIELVGIKEFSSSEKVTDILSLMIGDVPQRLQKLATSLNDSLIILDTFDTTSIPGLIKINNEFIKSNIHTIIDDKLLFNDIQMAVILSHDILSTMEETTEMIDDTIKTVLSPLHYLNHSYKQITCSLRTLIALPLDLYTSAYDNVRNLVDALKASGCGTTLMSNSNVGYNTLGK